MLHKVCNEKWHREMEPNQPPSHSSSRPREPQELARSVTHLLFFVLMVTSAVVVNAVVTPAFLVVAVPICGLYYAVQKFFRCSSR